MGLKILLAAFILGSVTLANAKTLYFLDGKQVNKAEAIMASLKDPSKEVLKVQVNWTKLNPTTANLNKSRDGAVKDIPR